MLDNVKSDPFDIAKQNLIEPYGLTEGDLFDLHNKLEVKGVDFADIYLQSIISESWNLEEGIVKGGAFLIDQGFGVRTVSGDRTSFAFSDTISQKTLREAVKNTLAISRTSTEKKKSIYLDGNKNRPKFGRVGSLYDYGNPVDAMSSQEKVELLQKIETLAKKKDPRISQVMASISGSFSIVVIVTDRGLITDLRPLVRLSVTAVAEEKNRKEFGVSGGGGRFAMNNFSGSTLETYVDEATRQALINLESRPAPAGLMSVVLGPGWPGILLHEAVGHGLEGDFNRKKSSVFSGRIGERVGAPGVTVVDNGTMSNRRGSLNVDDEGNPTQNNILIEDGILRGYMQDRLNSRLMKTNVTGNGRRESFAHLPMPRMTNTYMLPGNHDPGEVLESLEKGIYAVNFGGGQVDITNGKFVFSASEAYWVEKGKIKYPVKGATLIGNGPDALTKIKMVGSDLKLDSGVGTCGKEGQRVPVGVGQPTILIEGLTIGGTAE
jgi:TldD protein